jgi:hypothetical protein
MIRVIHLSLRATCKRDMFEPATQASHLKLYQNQLTTACNTSSVPVCARHTPNFATSAAKLVYRASRKGCSTWPGLKPRPTSNSELRFEAVLNSSLGYYMRIEDSRPYLYLSSAYKVDDRSLREAVLVIIEIAE